MTKMNYQDALSVMIETHRREAERHLAEVDRLTIALDVLTELRMVEGRPELLLRAERPPSISSSPLKGGEITIRSIAPVGKVKKVKLTPGVKQSRAKPKVDMPELTARVTAALAATPGLRNMEVCKAIDMLTPADEKRIFYALSKLVAEGKATKIDARYALVEETPPA